ncbi:MAG: transporter, family, fosmidomycin resistance protein, partial [Candidatus Eremiobacteraeota bacterium]|nr:transporter, family, fosmidomycin resistance protein [Candidatus Eremiobacteraeota bacterium]
MAFAHGASDLYSGVVPFVIFFDVTRAGLPAWYQGALAFAWYLTSSIAQPLVGAYSDRRGRWWFLPASVGLTAVAISLAAATTSVLGLVTCVVLGGLGSAVMHPEAGRYSTLLGGARRSSAISIFQIGGQLGYGIGPLVAAAALAHGGAASLAAMALPGVLAALAVATVMPGFARSADAVAPRRTPAGEPAAAVDRIALGLLVTSTALRHLVGASFAYYLPNLLTGAGLPLTAAGAVVTAFLVAAALGMYAGGATGDRFGNARVSIVGLVASVPPLLLGLATHGPLAIAALLLGSALLAVQNAPGVALVQSLLPRNLGAALGLINGVAFGIGSVGVALVGVLVTRGGAATAL